jgi:hypothetical protein
MNALRRAVDWLVRPEERQRLREDAGNAAKDAVVGVASLLLAFAVVVGASLALGRLVLGAGGTLGIVAGWVGMFALALLVPFGVMKLATALYARLGR